MTSPSLSRIANILNFRSTLEGRREGGRKGRWFASAIQLGGQPGVGCLSRNIFW